MTRTVEECSWAERAVLLVLHALEPEQEAMVAGHLRTCVACRATTREAEETFAAIGETAALAPPQDLRHRILAVVHEDLPTPSPMRADARHGRRRWVVAGAAAVLVAAMAGGGIVVAQFAGQRDAATVHAGTVDDLLAAIASSPHAVLVDRDRHPFAAVVLGDEPRFYALDLSPLPAGRVWVLWGARGRDMTALGTVPVGSGDVTSAPPVGRVGDYEAYLVSEEAAGPLPARPGQVRASGPVVAATGS